MVFGMLIFNIAIASDHNETSKKEKGIYEIITTGLYSYSPNENHGVFGAEFHLTYWVNHHWGGGLSYTGKTNKSKEVALLFSWNPNKWFTVNTGPSIYFKEINYVNFAGYGELEVNFRPRDWIHFGPVLGTTIRNHYEINSGFHLGFEF